MSLDPAIIFRSRNKTLADKWLSKHLPRLIRAEDHLTGEELQKYRELYQGQGYVRIPQLVHPTLVEALLELEKDLPSREVHVTDDRSQTWLEYKFDDDENILDPLFTNDPLKRLVQDVLNVSVSDIQATEGWINRYRCQEFIPEHTDSGGDHQFLLGLQSPSAPPPEGKLFVNERPLSLEGGDLIAFRAHEIPHYTEPVQSQSAGDRINAVLRIYEEPTHPD